MPHELIKSEAETGAAYELRLYRPRFVVEMAYKSREKAYMAFDKYLTGASVEASTSPCCRPASRPGTGSQGGSSSTGENAANTSLEAPAPIVMRHDPANVRCPSC